MRGLRSEHRQRRVGEYGVVAIRIQQPALLTAAPAGVEPLDPPRGQPRNCVLGQPAYSLGGASTATPCSQRSTFENEDSMRAINRVVPLLAVAALAFAGMGVAQVDSAASGGSQQVPSQESGTFDGPDGLSRSMNVV